ncbi:MAG: preprotein translocase subunit SecE [Coriobacteriia bacterium]|nr:preprotein translocase subunit SecE [Coriobacteriia bacterium]
MAQGKKSNKKAHGAPKKPSLIERFGDYLRGVVAEFKRVVWPSRQEVFNSTIVVIVTLIFFAIFTFVVDWISTGAIEFLLDLSAY